ANWAWGGGWLSQLGKAGLGAGYADFAGSGVVHSVGGFTALAGAMVLGPRLGKYNRDGTSNAIPGHNLVMGITGALILGFGWFGFNPGSTLGASGNGALRIGLIAVSTMIASMSGALVALLWSYIANKKWDPGQFAAQFIGAVVVIVWSFGVSYIFFRVLDAIMKIRVSPEVELAGLDLPEMGALAYPTDWEPDESFRPAPRVGGLATGMSAP